MASTNITTFPGKVGISNANPTHTLAIGSNVFVDDTGVNKLVVNGNISTTGQFTGDGVGLSNIQTSNVIGLTDNVTRIGTLETDLTDNVTRIGTLETDLTDNVTRIGTLETDLSDNSSRITSIESGEITITGVKTFQDDIILESNLRVQGDLLVANTVNMTVSDPILELGSNNLNTGDVGLVMTRHGSANSNVAIVFDESEDVLNMGYTLSGANDTTIELDSNALAVNIQGALTAASVNGDGSGLTNLNATNIGSGTLDKDRLPTTLNNTTIEDAGSATLTLHDSSGNNRAEVIYETTNYVWNAGVHGGDEGKFKISKDAFSTNDYLVIDTTGNVGIGTDTPAYKLDVHGTSNVGALTATTGAFSDDLAVGTSKLFVDVSTGNVGIGTSSPDAKLDVAGSAVFNTYMQVAREINQVSSSGDVVLLLTPSADGNKMSGTICGIGNLSGNRFRSGTVKLEVIVNTNSQSGGHAQERFSFIKHAIINVDSTYTPVTCDYNGINWFAIRIQGDGAEDPWYSWFSGLLQHNGGDDTLSIVSNDGVNVTNVVDFTAKETVQHTEFSNQDLIVSGGNIGIGTTSPVSILHVKGTGQTSTTSFDTSQTLGASIFAESSDSVVGSGGSLLFGTYQGKFAAIKAGILNGTSNTMGNLHFMTRNATGDATLTNRMTITNTGDVGIGVTSPLAKLHVNGDIYSPGVICQTQQYEYSSVGTVVITSGTLTLLNCLFTPKFSNSKILIQLSIPVQSSATYFNVFVDRGSTRITSNPGNYGIISYNSTVNLGGHFIHTGVGYDLPGTTSEISYNVVAEYGSGSALGILTQSGKLLVLIHELSQ